MDQIMDVQDLQTLISERLEDLSDQIAYLYEQGEDESAELLNTEALQLAEAFDNETEFCFINDLTNA